MGTSSRAGCGAGSVSDLAYPGPMEIVQVNFSDRGGGAERIALGLHREFRRRGHGATLAVGHALTGEDGVVELDDLTYRGPWARALSGVAGVISPLEGR